MSRGERLGDWSEGVVLQDEAGFFWSLDIWGHLRSEGGKEELISGIFWRIFWTHNPGRNLASRRMEQGTIKIGLVGSATNAVDGAGLDVAGLVAASGGVSEPLLTTLDFGVVVAELVF